MGFLRRAAGRALRGSGRLLSDHLVPDHITPWNLRQHASKASAISRTIFSLVPRKEKPKKKKKPARKSLWNWFSPTTATAPKGRASGARPSSTKGQTNLSRRREYERGEVLKTFAGAHRHEWDDSPAASRPSRSPSASRPRPRAVQQLIDFSRHPRLVLQMKADELTHGLRQKAHRFSSKFRR